VSERASYAKIGAFVLFGTLLFATGLAVFGSGLLQRGGIVVETYFRESVLGLDVGAAVYERGVKVGEVIEIDFVRTVYEIQPDDPRFDAAGSWVVARFRLRPSRGSYLRSASAEAAARLIEQMVARGLRVQLASSVVTQVAYLEISYQDTGRAPPLEPDGWKPTYDYIPSTQSTFARIGEAAEHVFARLDALDIEGLMTDLHAALTTATETLQAAKVPELSREAGGLIRELRETNRRAQSALAQLDTRELGEGLKESLARLERSLERADSLLGDAGGALRANSAQLTILLTDLRESVEALDDVLDDARDDPALLLLGAPPAPVELPEPR
jgi:ABC-type transporter Mla subunit MlaD